jgi:hypothetical protein
MRPLMRLLAKSPRYDERGDLHHIVSESGFQPHFE